MYTLRATTFLIMLQVVASWAGTAEAAPPRETSSALPAQEAVNVCADSDEPAQVVDVPATRGTGFNIAVDYTGSGFTPAAQQVFDAAIAMWEAVILANGGSGTFTVTPRFTPLGPGTLGLADQFTQDGFGIPVSGRVSIDSMDAWFVDPTPFDNSEYASDPTNSFQYINGPGAAANFDMLTVILQELAHCLGWTVGYSRFDDLVTDGPGALRTFDSGGFTVMLVGAAQGTHADPGTHPGDLMNPLLAGGTRRLVSHFASKTPLQRAYNYDTPLTFLDAAFTGDPSGSASEPFSGFAAGAAAADPDDVLIIKSGVYPLTGTVTLDRPAVLWGVLGPSSIGN